MRLVREQGYAATTTAAVARAAGVSEMTLFRHFPTKEALLLEDPYDPLMAEAVRRRPGEEAPMRALAEGVRSALGGLSPDEVEGLRAVMRLVSSTPALRGGVERNSAVTLAALTDALHARGVPTGAARVASAALIAGMSQALQDWSQDESRDLHTCLDEALDVLGGE